MKKNILDETFNTDKISVKQVTKEVKNLPAIINSDDAEKYVITTYIDVINQGKLILQKAVEQVSLSDTTQFDFKDLSPIATLMNALTYANDKLNNNIKPQPQMNKQKENIPPVVNNNVLVATTEEIIDKLKK